MRCQQCDQRFANEQLLTRHESKVHLIRTRPACNQCSKTFHNNNDLVLHKRYECTPDFDQLRSKAKIKVSELEQLSAKIVIAGQVLLDDVLNYLCTSSRLRTIRFIVKYDNMIQCCKALQVYDATVSGTNHRF